MHSSSYNQPASCFRLFDARRWCIDKLVSTAVHSLWPPKAPKGRLKATGEPYNGLFLECYPVAIVRYAMGDYVWLVL